MKAAVLSIMESGRIYRWAWAMTDGSSSLPPRRCERPMGCPADAIVGTLGLRLADLWPEVATDPRRRKPKTSGKTIVGGRWTTPWTAAAARSSRSR